ncbi:TadE/TadG family type IV pilus assembly protein [Methylobacillus flagellatus]|uniref:TadE/TadG family type IV pilus assembly protein n=1 Tax=Methylobacillus flagellatus TaxID=405 RepID=UPI0010F4FBCE|nr:TadE/TadG family type IV pilus assembly protein [Methylobacillus flagellatus]
MRKADNQSNGRAGLAKSQRGAVAIEFAIIFLLIFTLFYAIINYSLMFLLQASFAHASEEGARAAIAVDPLAFPSDSEYISAGVIPQVRTTVGNSLVWLPDGIKQKVLGAGNSRVQVDVTANVLTVRVEYANYMSQPILPSFNLPNGQPMLPLPSQLRGTAVLRLF